MPQAPAQPFHLSRYSPLNAQSVRVMSLLLVLNSSLQEYLSGICCGSLNLTILTANSSYINVGIKKILSTIFICLNFIKSQVVIEEGHLANLELEQSNKTNTAVDFKQFGYLFLDF
ncbi:hypothetical protein Ancab_012090 [Ancistrocladus abbreviatus]